MAENLSSEAQDALLTAIKNQAEQIADAASAPGEYSSNIKDLAEAYAWLQRPIRGTSR